MDSGLATEAMPDEYVSSLRISKFLLVNAESAKEGFYLFRVFLPSEKVDYRFRWEISSYKVPSC
jgi:hypothetical protein